jgi:general secretion pathway protein B
VSFILDALRKSEHDRQRQSGPGIADIRAVGAGGRFPLWAIAIGALLVVNIVVVLVLVFRGEARPTAAAPPTPAAAAPASPPASAQRAPESAVIPLPRRVEPQAEAAAPDFEDAPATGGEPSLDDTRSAVGAPARPGARRRDFSDPSLDAGAESDAGYASLPSVNDIVTQRGERAVPDLHLDIHVYATRPAERFVFLNMRKYREGGSTPEGTVVERITRDGVVLNHRGLRFVMPRQ